MNKREEPVRQWFLNVLGNECHVPASVMKSEVGFTLGSKQYRADILVWDRNAKPLAVVECKAPQVRLSADVLDQAIRYNMALDVNWIFLTNGLSTIVLRRTVSGYVLENELPDYERMLIDSF